VIPLKDRNPTRRVPIVTLLLLAANVAVYFLVQQGQSGFETIRLENGQLVEIDAEVAFTLEYAAIPCEIVERDPLTVDEIRATYVDQRDSSCGTGEPSAPELFPDKTEWLAVIFSMFLHGGLLHLGGNMLFLWIFGNNIEDHLGPVRYLAFYLLGGVAATLAHIAVDPDSTVPVVGASGAIAAVMGAYLIWFPRARVLSAIILVFFIFFREIEARWLLVFWFVLQFFTGPDSGVAWAAHVGGFVFGVFVGLLVRASDRAKHVAWRSAYKD
jgi:membrane associated rhomboid family serine protease